MIVDFQKATADRILHLFKDRRRQRVLLSDEVGLGKTFVAEQVVRLVKEWHREMGDKFFKVVYICSNANIADQNISKLGVNNNLEKISISESRLSMQHLYITRANKAIEANSQDTMPESIIPLTPTTSFRFYSMTGTAKERALIYIILREMPELISETDCLGKFLSSGVKNWNSLCNDYEEMIQRDCGNDYIGSMIEQLRHRLAIEDFHTLLDYAKSGCTNSQKSVIINKIRRTFAEISIDMLDPDLVIMDEFQRFSDLLQQDDNERSMLARRFFDPSRTNTKVLLLSATPYKPYSTLEELNREGKDEHYQDFIKLTDFLFVSSDASACFKSVWRHYSAALKRTEVTDLTPLIEAKQAAEENLYSVMTRTERFNQGIIDDSHVEEIGITPTDVLAYAEGQHLLDRLTQELPGLHTGNLPMEYVKSSPYLLSFMDKYELKKKIFRGLRKTGALSACSMETLLLNPYKINNYKKVDTAHGKLKYLHDLVFGEKREKKAHLLLWVPASYPYYKAGGLFESEDARHFSKVILFSAWEMVPRMVSAMMSYYSELYTLGEVKKRHPEIRYGKTKNRYGDNRLRTDNILEYPCRAMAGLFDFRVHYGKQLSEIRSAISEKVREMLASNSRIKGWDKVRRGSALQILNLMKILDGEEVNKEEELVVPDNAVDVLTDIAIASPAVCAYRLSRNVEDARIVAKAIVSIFNKPEAAAVIELIYNKKSDDYYYISVLDYCVKGNLQAVLDEYAHMQKTTALGDVIAEAILGTSTLLVDTKKSLQDEEKKMGMRCHFAIPFIDKTVTDGSVARTKNIQNAFNSPFRPFVLSSTSIGQEGLDFHMYSRRIVHWNLPSNPVDLEQREGRVNRFKCLAIRRNVAHLFCSEQYHSWDDLFEIARSALKGTNSDMVPYWCLPFDELSDAQRSKLEYIERIVPLFPFSRDKYKYERLIKVLSLYRMTLGQPRQEELLKMLKDMKLNEEQLQALTIDLCPYNKLKQLKWEFDDKC